MLMDTAKLPIEGNLHPAGAMYETACLPTLSYQAYLHLPGTGNKRYLEDYFILLFSEYQWGWAFFPPFKNHPHFHFCEQSTHILCSFFYLVVESCRDWVTGSLSLLGKSVLCLKLWLKTLSPLWRLSFYFADGVSVKFCFFTISNLTLWFHGSWVLSEIFKRLPFSKFLGKKANIVS